MPGVTVTNRSRVGESSLDYVATSMEGIPDVHHPNRDQIARIYANQTELNFKVQHRHLPSYSCSGRGGHSRDDRQVRLQCDQQLRYSLRPFPPNPYAQIDTESSGKGKVYDATIDTIGAYLYRYGPLVEAMDRQRRHPARRLQSRPGRRAGHQCAGLCGGKHGHCHEHGKRSCQPPQLECRPRLQADSDFELLCRLRDSRRARSEASSNSTGAQYNGISATLVNVPPQEARSVEIGHQVGTVRQAPACDSGLVPDRRRSRAHQ